MGWALNKNSLTYRENSLKQLIEQPMGLYSGGLIIGRIFVPEILGGLFLGGFIFGGGGGGLIIRLNLTV